MKGDQPKLDFSQLQDQILLFLVALRAPHPRHPRAAALGVGPGDARGAQLGGGRRGVGRPRQPHEDHDLRPLGRHRRLRRRVARPLQLQLRQHHRAAATSGCSGSRSRSRSASAGPAGALLAGFAFAAGAGGLPLDRQLVDPRRWHRQRAHYVDLLRADPVGARRHPAGPGARRHPRARRPAAARKKRAKERQARIAAAEAAAHDGVVPEHEIVHAHADGDRRAGSRRTEHPSPMRVLAMDGVVAGYGDAEVLHGVDLQPRRRQGRRAARRQRRGQVDALLGRRRASSTPTFGTVLLEGQDITARVVVPARARRPAARPRGARHLPRPHRRGEPHRAPPRSRRCASRPTTRFPILAERRKQVAGLLSGGEQQMLSLAPALADPPKVLIADEPTLGLAPLAAEAVMQAIVELRDAGIGGAARRGARAERAEGRRHARVHGARERSCGVVPAPTPTWSCWQPRTSAARVADVLDDGPGAPFPRRHRSNRGRRRAPRARRGARRPDDRRRRPSPRSTARSTPRSPPPSPAARPSTRRPRRSSVLTPSTSPRSRRCHRRSPTR